MRENERRRFRQKCTKIRCLRVSCDLHSKRVFSVVAYHLDCRKTHAMKAKEFDIAEEKAKVLRKYEPRSRVSNAVPVSKSKPLNRKKAKAARKARKR